MNFPAAGPGWSTQFNGRMFARCEPCGIECAEPICFNCGKPTRVLYRTEDLRPFDLELGGLP